MMTADDHARFAAYVEQRLRSDRRHAVVGAVLILVGMAMLVVSLMTPARLDGFALVGAITLLVGLPVFVNATDRAVARRTVLEYHRRHARR